MNLRSKLIIPGVVGMAAFTGITAASLLTTNGVSADTASTTSTTSQTTTASTTPPDQSQGGHVGTNGTKEVLLTGDTKTQAEAAAKAAQPSATIVRSETDAEGAAYEVHMQKSDGSMITVKLDSSFKVTATEDGPNAPSGQKPSSSSSSTSTTQ